ncbi:hypothetical protein DVA86_06510 [Streptomyces armeniacus]|uniref:Uncharacterized protein n=1 Tax=Streptomyces armeniacus TaxID=83291 RepID=A0A345XL35_9ACTN|nr:hypothetical protein [Streptomyces armeniacus]AXK32351.1 hypothetical protein DVA86_06510 [Streptomyces armeniacus]
MPHTTQDRTAGFQEAPPDTPLSTENRGCLYALSQPPLMFFLAFIGALLAITGFYDLFLL